MLKAEVAMWTLLRDRRLIKRKFRRQHTIGIYAVDFACPAVKLVIELDGRLHDEPEQIEFDARRTEYLKLNGWRIARFKNDEVFADNGAVLRKIVEAVGIDTHPHPAALRPSSPVQRERVIRACRCSARRVGASSSLRAFVRGSLRG
jgi:very-short-patch-repair endonuclease